MERAKRYLAGYLVRGRRRKVPCGLLTRAVLVGSMLVAIATGR